MSEKHKTQFTKEQNTHSKLGRMKNQGWDISKMDIKLRDKYLESWNQNGISCVIIITKKPQTNNDFNKTEKTEVGLEMRSESK